MSKFIDIAIPHCCKKSTTDPYNCFYEGPWMGHIRKGYNPEFDRIVEFQYQYKFYRATLPRCHIEERKHNGWGEYRCLLIGCIEHVAGYWAAHDIHKHDIFRYTNQHKKGMVIESTQRYCYQEMYYEMPVEDFLQLDLSDYYFPQDCEDEEFQRAYDGNVEYLTRQFGKAFRQMTELQKLLLVHKAFKTQIYEARKYQADF